MELWHQAAQWLMVIDVLPDFPSNISSARVYDLALALQDGTVLCNLANKLYRNAVQLVHQKPEKQFMKMQNINSFLAACEKTFKMSSSDLFTADQLYYASDFAKVVHTLSVLSKTQIAGLAGYKFFPPDDTVDEDGEDTYQSLETLVGQSLSLQEARQNHAAPIFSMDDEDDEDDIYGNIREVIDESGGDEVYAGLLYSEGTEDIYGTGALTPDEKRNCVLGELYDTEKNYVKLLHTIIDVFQKNLAKQLSRLDVSTIFVNVGELLVAHEGLLASLDAQMASQTGRMISGVMIENMKTLRCYARFCCEIPEAISKLKDLAMKPNTAKILDAAKAQSGQRFPLKDLLNVPMQRVLKYPLLIKELIKNTPESHPDKPGLQKALIQVNDLAKYINDTKKEHDNLKNMIASLKSYQGKPLGEFGALIKDGDLMHKKLEYKANETPKEKLKPRYVFLFSTAIVACKSQGNFFKYKFTIELDAGDYTIEDVPFWSLPREEQNGQCTYAWSMKKQKGNQIVQHIFAARTLPSKKKWQTAMQLNLDAINDSKAAPPMVTPRGASQRISPSKKQEKAKEASPAKRPQPPTPQKASYEQWVVGQGPPVPGGGGGDGEGRQNQFGQTDDAWFAGKVPRAKAEKMLSGVHDGTFLVRESETRKGDYSLSVKYGHVKHIKINRHAGPDGGVQYDLAPDAKAFPSIQELVEHFQNHSLNRHFPGMSTTLEIPFCHAVSGTNMPVTPGTTEASKRQVGIGRARSRFAYQARSDDELSFERGMEICILSTHDQDPGWWKGSLPTGEVGIFPANYVQQL